MSSQSNIRQQSNKEDIIRAQIADALINKVSKQFNIKRETFEKKALIVNVKSSQTASVEPQKSEVEPDQQRYDDKTVARKCYEMLPMTHLCVCNDE